MRSSCRDFGWEEWVFDKNDRVTVSISRDLVDVFFALYSNGKSLLATPKRSKFSFCIEFPNKQICSHWFFFCLLLQPPHRVQLSCFPFSPLVFSLPLASSRNQINKTFRLQVAIAVFSSSSSFFAGNFMESPAVRMKFTVVNTRKKPADVSALHKKSSVI